MAEFVTCLNCMDGRTQQVMIDWLKKNQQAKYVDMITEAGMDGFIAKNQDLPESLCYKIEISTKKHGSKDIFIVGHHDCGGHPVEKQKHFEDIKTACAKLKSEYPDCFVSGIWISEKWQAEIVSN